MALNNTMGKFKYSIINYKGYSVDFDKRMDYGDSCWKLEAKNIENNSQIVTETYGSEVNALSSILVCIDKATNLSLPSTIKI
jgi:hypothetical protein